MTKLRQRFEQDGLRDGYGVSPSDGSDRKAGQTIGRDNRRESEKQRSEEYEPAQGTPDLRNSLGG